VKQILVEGEAGLLEPAWVDPEGGYCTKPVRQDDESYVTEIQVPVEKAAAPGN